MAGLESLVPRIYHEKQQQGSMLCAQHALNSLLQGNYFTAPDLSEIARHLDVLEESYDDDNLGRASTNMDDTGLFSVQVLDDALKVWGLNLVRWRGESMRPYRDHPHTQLGFILNLEQHWLTLRRFGTAVANMDFDVGNGHWFNLNSFLAAPEWVGKLYLGMVLQQAEAEGYSVFAVTEIDPEAPLALPRTEADEIAATLPEPTSASSSQPRASLRRTLEDRVTSSERSSNLDLEDEDYELQAALQASLMGGAAGDVAHPPFIPPPMISAPWSSFNREVSSAEHDSGVHTPQNTRPAPTGLSIPGHADIDPVVASMERSRLLLQRMREQQEIAQQELWSGEDLTADERAVLEERRERRRREEEEEEEQLRRAIEESESLAQHGHSVNQTDTVPPTLFPPNLQVYDDDDAELQAALKASLEPTQSGRTKHDLQTTSTSVDRPIDADDTESIISSTSHAEEPSIQGAPPLTLDEIRKARLARFGL